MLPVPARGCFLRPHGGGCENSSTEQAAKAVVTSWDIFILGACLSELMVCRGPCLHTPSLHSEQARFWQRSRRGRFICCSCEHFGQATTRGLEMQMQDALDFRDGLWQVERTVRAGDDEFGVRCRGARL